MSGASDDDRVREVALVLFEFHPTDGLDGVLAVARAAGFPEGSVGVFTAHTPGRLADTLVGIGHSDQVLAQPNTLDQVLQALDAEFADLVVTERAYAAACGYAMPRLDDVLRDMRTVHLIYGRRIDLNGNPIEPRDRKQLLQSITGKVLQWENDDVIARYRTAFFPELGETVQFPMHLEYSHNYSRIHFWFANRNAPRGDGIVTAITHAGEHLEGARRRQ